MCGPERADTEKLPGGVDVSIVWADNVAFALDELQRRNMPVLLDLQALSLAMVYDFETGGIETLRSRRGWFDPLSRSPGPVREARSSADG